MGTAKVRNYKYDNIRFFLIYLVVLCHLLGELSGSNITAVYKIVYSFHMPAFLFLSGYFAKFNGRKLVTNFMLPYVIFQILYKLFNYYVTGFSKKLVLEFTYPKYVLWYLFVLIIYYLLIPLFSSFKGKERMVALVITLVISLIVGFDTSNENPAIFRACSFLPFFFSGYYIGHPTDEDLVTYNRFYALFGRVDLDENSLPKNSLFKSFSLDKLRLIIGLILALFAMASSYIVLHCHITKTMLYAKKSYADAGYNPAIKLLIMLIATIWIALIFIAFQNKKLPIVSSIGSRTLAIFILHGFVVKYLRYIGFFHYSQNVNLILAMVVALALLLILGLRKVHSAFTYVFCAGFIKK